MYNVLRAGYAMISNQHEVTIKASDLRGILEYVPLYRNQTFVIAVDGSVIECDNFPNLVTDIAVLRSLGINVVVVHGIGSQLKAAGKARGVQLSDVYGNDPVDDATLSLAREVSANVLQTIVDTFTTKNLKCATVNAVRATEVGIISGEYKGVHAPTQGKYVKATYLDVDLQPDTEWEFENDPKNTLFIYIVQGSLESAGEAFENRRAVLFGEGEKLWVKSGARGARFLMLTAKPLKEPVAWGGPIVMNTREELAQAFDELNNGTFEKKKS